MCLPLQDFANDPQVVTVFEKRRAMSESDICQGGQCAPIECLEYVVSHRLIEGKTSNSNEREWCLSDELFDKITNQDSHLIIFLFGSIESANCQGSQLRLGNFFTQLIEHKT